MQENFYLDNIDREKNDVHIIYWNRDLQEENLDFLKDCHEPYVVITSGDAVYKLDYEKLARYCGFGRSTGGGAFENVGRTWIL